jgi:hypothetical protein
MVEADAQHALSYAALSTAIILSTPAILAACSAMLFILLPATNPVIEPPSFCAAVTELDEPWINLPSRCSRTANDESNRARAERLCTDGLLLFDLNCVRAWYRTDRPAMDSILSFASVRKRAQRHGGSCYI